MDLSRSVKTEEDGVTVERYGWNCLTTRSIQVINNVKGFLICYLIFSTCASMHTGGLASINVTSLERRFGFNSVTSGIIVSGYSFGFCLASVLVSYFGANFHTPRTLAVAALINCFGCLLYVIPHFTSSVYIVDGNFSDTCNNLSCQSYETAQTYQSHHAYILFAGMFLSGGSINPLLTIGLSYIDDSVSKYKAPIYLGICNASFIFGPAIGYFVGGFFLRHLYVDYPVVHSLNITVTETDPTWVGAWWMGPIFAAVFVLLSALLLAGFPRYLPSTARIEKYKSGGLKETDCESKTMQSSSASDRNFAKATYELLRRPTIVLITLAGCCDAVIINGFGSFMAKLIENAFHQTSGKAALWAGVVLVPGGILGHVGSGWIIGKLKMSTDQVIKFCILMSVVAAFFSYTTLLSCENPDIAGVTHSYINNNTFESFPPIKSNLTSHCNSQCRCQEEFYYPVCGSDGIQYFSACHAGCSKSEEVNGSTIYSECSCIANSSANETQNALAGLCVTSCSTFPVFLVLFVFTTTFMLMSGAGILIISLRVTPNSLKSFTLGLQWLVVKVVGSIPGPIIFGNVIDFSCILWQRSRCGEAGSCWIYDSKNMAFYMALLGSSSKVLSAILFSLALMTFRKQKVNQSSTTVAIKE